MESKKKMKLAVIVFFTRQVAIFALTFLLLSNLFINLNCVVRISERDSDAYYKELILQKTQRSMQHHSKDTSENDGTSLGIYDPSTENLKTTKSLNYNIAKSCQYKPGKGNEGRGGYKVLQKVKQGLQKHPDKPKTTEESRPKILCMVYSYSKNEKQVEAIVNTWAQKCDGFFTSADVENRELGMLNLRQNGKESYDNMWQKTRTMLYYAYQHYKDDYDYFHM